jgi:hypothetical protein
MLKQFAGAGAILALSTAAEAQTVTIPGPHWSLEKFERLDLPGAPAREERPGFASSLASSLGERGIGIEHSAIILGREVGGGFRLYLGEAPGKIPHTSVLGAGVELSLKF